MLNDANLRRIPTSLSMVIEPKTRSVAIEYSPETTDVNLKHGPDLIHLARTTPRFFINFSWTHFDHPACTFWIDTNGTYPVPMRQSLCFEKSYLIPASFTQVGWYKTLRGYIINLRRLFAKIRVGSASYTRVCIYWHSSHAELKIQRKVLYTYLPRNCSIGSGFNAFLLVGLFFYRHSSHADLRY